MLKSKIIRAKPDVIHYVEAPKINEEELQTASLPSGDKHRHSTVLVTTMLIAHFREKYLKLISNNFSMKFKMNVM